MAAYLGKVQSAVTDFNIMLPITENVAEQRAQCYKLFTVLTLAGLRLIWRVLRHRFSMDHSFLPWKRCLQVCCVVLRCFLTPIQQLRGLLWFLKLHPSIISPKISSHSVVEKGGNDLFAHIVSNQVIIERSVMRYMVAHLKQMWYLWMIPLIS